MTALEESLTGYLAIRRRLGFEMPQDGRLLESFVEFLDQAGASRITTELALAWARLPADAHPHRWRQRLSVVRGFARHLATIDPTSEVLSTDLLPGNRPRITPYIYTDAEIAALMTAARQLEPRLRGVRHATLIGLLAVTGLFSRGEQVREEGKCCLAPGGGRSDASRTCATRVVHVPVCRQEVRRALSCVMSSRLAARAASSSWSRSSSCKRRSTTC